MDPLWAHDDMVMLVEPFDKVISLGWDAVKKNFDKEFSQLAGTENNAGGRPSYPSSRQCGLVCWHDKCQC